MGRPVRWSEGRSWPWRRARKWRTTWPWRWARKRRTAWPWRWTWKRRTAWPWTASARATSSRTTSSASLLQHQLLYLHSAFYTLKSRSPLNIFHIVFCFLRLCFCPPFLLHAVGSFQVRYFHSLSALTPPKFPPFSRKIPAFYRFHSLLRYNIPADLVTKFPYHLLIQSFIIHGTVSIFQLIAGIGHITVQPPGSSWIQVSQRFYFMHWHTLSEFLLMLIYAWAAGMLLLGNYMFQSAGAKNLRKEPATGRFCRCNRRFQRDFLLHKKQPEIINQFPAALSQFFFTYPNACSSASCSSFPRTISVCPISTSLTYR